MKQEPLDANPRNPGRSRPGGCQLSLWTEEDLPSPYGFLVFPDIQHFHLDPDGVLPDELIALSWRPGGNYTKGMFGQLQPHNSLFATTWVDRFGPVKSTQFKAAEVLARRNGDSLPAILPLHRSYAELGSKYSNVALDRDLLEISISPNREVEGEFSGEAIRDPRSTTWTLRYLMAFTRLVQQRVTSPERFSKGVDSRSKPRAHHDVRVVQLRSYSESSKTGDPGAAAARSYSRRWVVKMHKVNQWYPKEKVHKIQWRGPYIKGPENAPLLAGEKVHALTR